MTTTTPLLCSVCGYPVDVQPNGWHLGHNAWPVNAGRCCTSCNWDVVIPVRLEQLERADRLSS